MTASNGAILINSQGIHIYCLPRAHQQYLAIKAKSGNANFWARTIVNEILRLSTGIANSDNVYTEPTQNANKGGMVDFHLILPGCTVVGQRHDASHYTITKIEPSLDYANLQDVGVKPGLHSVKKIGLKWDVSPITTGQLTGGRDCNVVGVSDACYERPIKAAERVGIRINGAGVYSSVEDKGYDLYHTPGKRRLGGLLNYRQAIRANTDRRLTESATLLANVMAESRGMDDVVWFADMGGSAVLTQAMHMAAQRGVTLPKHKIFLHRPTSSADVAYQNAQKLGMKFDRNFIKSNVLNINELVGAASFALPYRRKQLESNYSALQMGVDYGKAILGGKQVWAMGAAMGAAFTASAFAPATLTVLGACAAAGKVAGLVPLLTAHMPDTVDRFTSKL